MDVMEIPDDVGFTDGTNEDSHERAMSSINCFYQTVSNFISFGFFCGVEFANNTGSRVVPYSTTPEGFGPSRFNSISAMPHYGNRNHEELRLEDYERKGFGFPVQNQGNPFQQLNAPFPTSPILNQGNHFGTETASGVSDSSVKPEFSSTNTKMFSYVVDFNSRPSTLSCNSTNESTSSIFRIHNMPPSAPPRASSGSGTSIFEFPTVSVHKGSSISSTQGFGITSAPKSGSTSTPGFDFTSAPLSCSTSQSIGSFLPGPISNCNTVAPSSLNNLSRFSFGIQSSSGLQGVTSAGAAKYSATREVVEDKWTGGKIQSISAMPSYEDKSHEELRSEDYGRHIKGGNFNSSCKETFGIPSHNIFHPKPLSQQSSVPSPFSPLKSSLFEPTRENLVTPSSTAFTAPTSVSSPFSPLKSSFFEPTRENLVTPSSTAFTAPISVSSPFCPLKSSFFEPTRENLVTPSSTASTAPTSVSSPFSRLKSSFFEPTRENLVTPSSTASTAPTSVSSLFSPFKSSLFEPTRENLVTLSSTAFTAPTSVSSPFSPLKSSFFEPTRENLVTPSSTASTAPTSVSSLCSPFKSSFFEPGRENLATSSSTAFTAPTSFPSENLCCCGDWNYSRTQAFTSQPTTASFTHSFTPPSVIPSNDGSVGTSSFTKPSVIISPSTQSISVTASNPSPSVMKSTEPQQTAEKMGPFSTDAPDKSSPSSSGVTKVELNSQNNNGQQCTTSSILSMQPLLVFARRFPIDQPNAVESIRHGISSLPTTSNLSSNRMKPLIRIRHVASTNPGLRTLKPNGKSSETKVPFFIDDDDIPRPVAPFLPRENPRAWVNISVSCDSPQDSQGDEVEHRTIPARLNENSNRPAVDTAIQHGDMSAPLNQHQDDATARHRADDVLALLPKLPYGGYYTEPSLHKLTAKEMEEPGFCSHVKDFVVGRQGYGSIKFTGETDVRHLDIESIVQFSNREVIVYPNGRKMPEVGQELNKAAEVTLLNVKCINKTTGNQYVEGHQVDSYREMLMKKSQEQGAEFVSYDPVEGEWKFRVQHF